MKRNVLYFIYGLGERDPEHQMLQLAQCVKAAGHQVTRRGREIGKPVPGDSR